jgi:hypothetical protein
MDELKNPAVATSMIVHFSSLLRNKRCALAYLCAAFPLLPPRTHALRGAEYDSSFSCRNYRMNKVKDLYWETGMNVQCLMLQEKV